ncbi:hexosaminidase D-like [Porites lutea]|uniref:hexosaminidase D-like n=1 Tax=Porites lutea TaxID=51062 RepID=UPI003CC6CF9F
MKIMRINYTNVSVVVALLVVSYVFFRLVQRSQLVTADTESVPQTSAKASIDRINAVSDKLVEARLKEDQETIASLREELLKARTQLDKRTEVKEDKMDPSNKKFTGHKLVHLDLKGAPPKIDYLIKILPLFAKWGASGLLVEYEDVFPYKAKYEVLQSKNSYSEDDIKRFLEAAHANELIVIPLVQTFGHLEFVLKHKEFSHLRETEHYTNSVCPSNKGSVPMVLELIDQVLALHPDIKWFHIGGDEVWNLKTCPVCIKDERNKSQLFVHHMTPILKHLQSKEITPIMWDDMMRWSPVEYLKELGSLVEPMVWAYTSDLTGYFPPGMWQRYGEAFKRVWAASAFKGATHPWSNFVPIGFHVQNNLNWLKIIDELPSTLKVNGIALTGWSRFDHYATLCELLPAALPSLAYCLEALNQGYMDEELRKSTAKKLGLPETFPLNVMRFNQYHPPDGSFPGQEIFKLVGELKKALYYAQGVSNIEQGWVLEREVESKFLSYYHLSSAINRTIHGLEILTAVEKEADRVLSDVYDDYVVKEWMRDKIDNIIKHLNNEKTRLEELLKGAAQSEEKKV